MASSIMIKLIFFTMAAEVFSGAILPDSPCNFPFTIVGWTEWFDRDDPSGEGDWESLSDLRKEYPGKICNNLMNVEATTLSGQSVSEAGQNIYRYDLKSAFICRNEDQIDKKCLDYRVRFSCPPPSCSDNLCWTGFYNRDTPSGSGDWESLSDLRKENPGQICANPKYIQAVTTDTSIPATETGQKYFIYNPTKGFVCRNQDQNTGECRDYKVRFACPCA